MRDDKAFRDLVGVRLPVLENGKGHVVLVDAMGTDDDVVEAARVSYNRDASLDLIAVGSDHEPHTVRSPEDMAKRRHLVRYLMRHRHTTPLEMCELKFHVMVPMDCWRQWIRHRTASVNEYSTRYSVAIDDVQVTQPHEWRTQSASSKQGSAGPLEGYVSHLPSVVDTAGLVRVRGTYNEMRKGQLYRMDRLKALPADNERGQITERTTRLYWADDVGKPRWVNITHAQHDQGRIGEVLSALEQESHMGARDLYELALAAGVAREQARKDLPLCTYTRAYWKIDLHNLLHFLGLRMHEHAQQEARAYANVIGEVVKQLYPVVWEAFIDYHPHMGGMSMSRLDIEAVQWLFKVNGPDVTRANLLKNMQVAVSEGHAHPAHFREWIHADTKDIREFEEFITKARRMGVVRA